MNEKVKIVLLGDSITQGIGSRQINYEKKLKSYLNANGIESSIFNLALTGTTIDHAFEHYSSPLRSPFFIGTQAKIPPR